MTSWPTRSKARLWIARPTANLRCAGIEHRRHGEARARTQSAKVAARTPRSLRIAFFLMFGSSGSSGMGVAGISRYCLIQNARCRDVGPRRALWVNPIDRLADLFEPEVTRGIGWACVALGSARPPLPDLARNPFQWCKTLKFLRCHALPVFGERPEPDTVCGPARTGRHFGTGAGSV